ncbi:dTDP-4-dehydrorhamnose reductase [Mariniflexile sp.]|uniref:dTDP-4-dehydrorhamnose reductase n=1 Tax=Mariniflexile sp. TaxID=1979402 RepID=UPI00356380F8
MITVLVTGSNGQLGNCIKDLDDGNLNIIYSDYQELNICNLTQVQEFFQSEGPIHYCINCAAYTAVDNAEKDQEKAFNINVLGAKNLALACVENDTTLIHISTDFVFDGKKQNPYTEEDEVNPISVYGETKLKGEIEIQQLLKKYFIIRTSWLYSEHGTNFLKTMLRLSKEKEELRIINDQLGTPTYAGDLALVLFLIVRTESQKHGVYHYSNEGVTSWFDFAKAIFEVENLQIKLNPIPTTSYPTPAKRPAYSVMDKSKIKRELGIEISSWTESLKLALSNIKKLQTRDV